MSDASRPAAHDDPNVIRKQIEETRERIADTAEALAYKTDVPARVKEKVADRVETVKGKLGDAASSLAHGVSDATHAASAVVADASVSLSKGVHDVSQTAKSNIGDATSSLDDTTATVKSKIAGATDKLADATGNVKGNIADATASVRANVSGLGDAAQEKLANSGEATKSLALSTKGFLEKNPLGLVIGSVAAGFLLGLALPVSDLERDNVGPLGDKMKDSAKSAASEIVTQGKAVVATAVTDALAGSKN
ncbi:MAG: hypothetical protein NVSMB19_24930 [Vulcanimicrobiaceae bacterium]